MSDELSDREVVARFMEPKPEKSAHHNDGSRYWSPSGWWSLPPNGEWMGRNYGLDELHLVEARLSDEQLSHYDRELNHSMGRTKPKRRAWYSWNATAKEKVAALAAVLRASDPSAAREDE